MTPGMVITLISALEKQRQVDLYDCEAITVYIANSRPAQARLHSETLSQNQTKRSYLNKKVLSIILLFY